MVMSEERARARERLSAIRANRAGWRDSPGEESPSRDEFDAVPGDSALPRWLQDSALGVDENGGHRDYDDYDYDAPRHPSDRVSSSRFDALPEHWRGARWRPSRRTTWILALVAVLATATGIFTVWWDSPTVQAVPPLPTAQPVAQPVPADAHSGDPTTAPAASQPTAEELVVSVVGLVHVPGLVRLPAGARVADALAAAGGPLDGADTVALNLAQKVADGDQVVVGVVGEAPTSSSTSVGGAAESAPGRPSSSALVDLNTATETELDALPGVGPVTAAAIVAWRTSNGKFTDVEQLGEVDGIGPARLAKLRTLVSV